MKYNHYPILILGVLLSLMLGFSGIVLAQDDSVVYQKKTVYNFDDDTITGDLKSPDQEFLTGRKGAHHKSLIRIRENFKEKILQSAKDL
jgi:hypothetical protein